MNKSVKIGKYEYSLSTRKNKKLAVTVGKKTIHFGEKTMEHHSDKTGLLDKKLSHNDEKRRANYLSRSGGIKDSSGKLTKDDPNSSNYHAIRILWNG
jgi:hypothetical protein